MRMRLKLLWGLIASYALLKCAGLSHAAGIPEFEQVVLDPDIGKVCYAVTVADVNGDGKPDPVALSENRLIWFENPSWKPHVILENQLKLDHVCLAPHDIDGDGKIDFAVGAGWTKVGTIQWISRDSDNPDGLWKVYPISVEPWTHRMRWGDVLGTGKPQLTVSPLNKSQGNGVRLQAFEIPADPRKDRWQPTLLSDSLNKMHNHWHPPARRPDAPQITLTASEEGISVIRRPNDSNDFVRNSLAEFGNVDVNPKGAGEVKGGRLADGLILVASVEPFHGNELAAYVVDWRDRDNRSVKRYLLTDKMKRGHALWLADVDNDDQDEIIIGHSDPGEGEFATPSISVYDAASEGDGFTWTRTILDNKNITSEDLIAHDFNGDGWIDVLAGGRASHNVKLYLNKGGK